MSNLFTLWRSGSSEQLSVIEEERVEEEEDFLFISKRRKGVGAEVIPSPNPQL